MRWHFQPRLDFLRAVAADTEVWRDGVRMMACECRSGLWSYLELTRVPAGWLVPFTYINLGRLDSPTATLAHVRLIVPASQGQASAAANVYPCFYEIKYQRGL